MWMTSIPVFASTPISHSPRRMPSHRKSSKEFHAGSWIKCSRAMIFVSQPGIVHDRCSGE